MPIRNTWVPPAPSPRTLAIFLIDFLGPECLVLVSCLLRRWRARGPCHRPHRLENCARSIFGRKYFFHAVYSYLFIFSYFLHRFRNDTQQRESERRKKNTNTHTLTVWRECDDERKTRKKINSDAKGSLDGTIFTYILRQWRWQRLACTIKKH